MNTEKKDKKSFKKRVLHKAKCIVKLPEKQTVEHQFMPAVLEITETPPAPLGRAILYTIMVVFTVVILLTCLTHTDIVAVAPGKIISSGKIKLIQPLKSGVVQEIYVRDGQMVKKGDPLIKIKFEESENNRIRLEQELLFASIDVLRYEALLTDDPVNNFILPTDLSGTLVLKNKKLLRADLEKLNAEIKVLDGQIDQVGAEMQTLEAEIQKVKNAIPNLQETVDIKASLLKDRLVSKIQYLDLERQLIEYKETMAVNHKRLEESKIKLETLQSQKNQVRMQFENEMRYKLQESSNKEEILKKELINAIWVDNLAEIKAPENGVIQELEIYTVGGVVTPAQTLMKLVPEDAVLEVEATLLNKDMGFVKIGQETSIKVDSFPYTKYGFITGKILHISGDAIMHEELGPVYAIRVSMDKTTIAAEDREIRLSPGMTVTAEVKTGKRRIIEYIMAPFIRYKTESMRER